MSIDTRPGRHRAPAGFSPLGELKSLARESAQPAMKGAAVVAAAGGLVATFAQPSAAESLTKVATTAEVPAVVGPQAGATAAKSALTAIGFAAAPAAAPAAKPVAAPKPTVIEDVVVKQRIAAKAAAAAKARADKAAAERASRTTSRTALTNSTSTTKTVVNDSPRATSGGRSSSNWATRGQCTWGALNKWYQSEGYYPGGWTGNAESWAYGARNAGYTVSGTPRTRSILVMQAGVHGSSSVGHVAWVTAVNGSQVTIVEMNALAGAYNYNTRTLTDQAGMQYIYAP